MERLDGYLVSFLYGAGALDGLALPFQQLVVVAEDGTVQDLAQRELPVDGPALWHHAAFWPSPLVNALVNGAQELFSAPSVLLAGAPPRRPAAIRTLAAGMAVVCLLLGFWRLRQLELGPAARWSWLVLCGLCGVPAVVALLLIHPAPARLVAVRSGAPAIA
jgi:hypothetical protein